MLCVLHEESNSAQCLLFPNFWGKCPQQMINWLHVNWLSALLRLGDLVCDKMGWRRYFGFVLLVWFQRLQHVRPSDQPCSAPELNGGYLVPEQSSYDHKTTLYYGCDNGRKPAVEGWWATSTCLDGIWSPKPQCIENINSCEEPPQIPHAVIIHRGYQEIFPDSTELEYECEDGYSVDAANSKESLYCISGNWIPSPPCLWGRAGGGRGTSTGTETQPEGHTTSDDRGTRAVVRVTNCAERPTVANGDVVEIGEMFLKYQCNNYYKLVGPEKVVCYSNGLWSEVPTCKANFCSVDTDRDPKFISDGVKFVGNGEKLRLECEETGIFVQYSDGVCTDGRIEFSACKYKCNFIAVNDSSIIVQ
uniref:complement factor H-like isoform X3 n=1 Tax=Gasterosteus aculeatus aculeatus TaxID=481459 RepID=UPI001A98F9BF|nr:complement factor H-like isoform X3 [Gasterosteus aculeatus aculeatus]